MYVDGDFDPILKNSVALRSDWVDVQVDLELHCPHMSEDPFSHEAAQI